MEHWTMQSVIELVVCVFQVICCTRALWFLNSCNVLYVLKTLFILW